MQNLNFETPVWVRYVDGAYHVRALMADTQVYSFPRLEKALRTFSTEVRDAYLNQEMEREGFSALMWYSFSPQIHPEILNLDFEYGNRRFAGKALVYWFEVKEMTIMGIPVAGTDLFVLPFKRPNRKELTGQAESQLQDLARKHKRDTGESINFDAWLQPAKAEYITTVELSLSMWNQKIQLENDAEDYFRQLHRKQMDFNGGYEITRVGRSLNQLFPDGLSHFFYHEALVREVGQLLFGGDNVPVVLLGPRGVGKTSLVHEALYRFLSDREPKDLALQSQLWEVDPTRIISGMSIVGMWQRRLEAIIRYVLQPAPNFPHRKDKLYFNNVVALFRIGKTGQNNLTLSDVLKPYLQNRQLQVVLEATPEEWDVASEMDRSFTDLFKVIRIQEPSDETAYRIIAKLRIQYEASTSLSISVPALWRLIELQRRFYPREALVGRVANAMQQLAAKFRYQEVDIERVLQEFSAQTHLHPRFANRDYLPEPEEYHKHFSGRLIGQPDAVDCLVEVLHSIKAQINNPERPFGSFLFIGPTGVGKTQAAKELARYLFTHEEGLVRFDMNEFIDGDAVNRLVGDFHNPEGQLTSRIRYNPYCVLLFDEIEKAHHEVHNLLLQVLGEGRLTDSLGRTVSFHNTVIIMTSNLGAERVGKEINLMGREDVAASTYRKAVMDFFRPEFINRIDKVVIFNRLRAEHFSRIAWLQINDLLRRHGFVRRHTILRVSPEALERLAMRGFDPELGGRALKRQIEKEMTVLLAEQLVTLSPGFPIIFDLQLKDDRIQPQLITLEPVEPLPLDSWPDFSGIKIQKEEVERLLERLMDIKADLLDGEEEENGAVNILEALKRNEGLETSFSLKDQLYQLEEELQRLLWEYSVRRKQRYDAPLYGLRALLPLNGEQNQTGWARMAGGGKFHERLHELYQQATPAIPETNARFFALAQRVSWLDYFVSEYYEQGIDHVLLYMGARTVPSGIKYHDAEYILEYLEFHYSLSYSREEVYPFRHFDVEHDYDDEKLFPFADVESFMVPGKNARVLYLKGPGLYKLFQQEVGIHLCAIPPNPPVPVEVKLRLLQKEEEVEEVVKQLVEREEGDLTEGQLPIVRMYSFAEFGQGNRKYGSLLDFRSGLMLNTPTNVQDFKLLFFAQLSDTYQFQLDEHD